MTSYSFDKPSCRSHNYRAVRPTTTNCQSNTASRNAIRFSAIDTKGVSGSRPKQKGTHWTRRPTKNSGTTTANFTHRRAATFTSGWTFTSCRYGQTAMATTAGDGGERTKQLRSTAKAYLTTSAGHNCRAAATRKRRCSTTATVFGWTAAISSSGNRCRPWS